MSEVPEEPTPVASGPDWSSDEEIYAHDRWVRENNAYLAVLREQEQAEIAAAAAQG